MSLIEDAKNKNPDAFEQLIQPQLQRMYRVAISMLHNEEDAADAIQETVLKCWQKIGQLKSEEYFGTWLTRILSGDAKSFDRVAQKWNVDYAFYKTGPDKYLLFFKAGQADAMTACFSEYSRKVLSKAKSNRVPIREQLQQAADQLSKEKPKQKERAKEVAHEDR